MNTETKFFQSEILFQKLGNTWYAFTEVDGEFLFRALPQGLDPRKTKIEFTQILHSDFSNVTTQNERVTAA